MSFLVPTLPDLDVAEWRRRPYLHGLRPLARHWVEHGFGVPTAVYLLYVVKVTLYAAGGAALISLTTPSLGGLGQIGSWWHEPVVFEKAVVWTMLLEVLGLAGASGPLTVRFLPPVGGLLYWLRPGTTRLPPWPDRVPLTAGSRRTVVDVALYAGIIAASVAVLVASPTRAACCPPPCSCPSRWRSRCSACGTRRSSSRRAPSSTG
jgi:hypothetical protein